MTRDKEHLQWIHNRIVEVYGESENVDFLIRMRKIIDKQDTELNLHSVSNPLPTKEEVIAEGDKQIEDWLSENSEHDQRVYRVAFRRSYEYVLRFIK